MHNHVANRGRKALLKQIFSVFLIFTLYFNAFSSAHAAGFGAWSITNTVAQGASTILTGSKEVILNGAKKIATGTAKITPTASQVSKVLARGAAGYALSVAVEQLLGAVDWVLDPANNQIVYTPDASPTQPNPNIPKFWLIQDKYINPDQIGFSSVAAACTFLIGKKLWSTSPVVGSVDPTESGCMTYSNTGALFGSVGLAYVSNPAYDPAKEEEKKTLPLETVAQKVISNAESGDTNAQVATTAAAADIIEEAETDNVKARPIVQQLENTQSIPTDQTAKGDAVPKENANTENPSSSVAAPSTDLTLDFPIFCDWAPSICQAAKWVITQPQVWADAVADSWDWTKTKYEQVTADIKEYFKDEPIEHEEPEPPQEMELPQFQADAFKATAGCPPDIPIHVSIGTGGNATISYEPICQFAEKWSFVAPLIGFLSGAMILIGVGRKGEDGEI